MENLFSYLVLLALLVAFWFIMLRPQRKQLQARAAMQRALQPGDEVVTAGGLIATVRRLDDDVVTIDLGPSAQAKIDRRYIIGKKNPEADVVADDTGAAVDSKESDQR